MKLHPSTYLLILRGRNVGTVSYVRGLLFSVTLCTGVKEEVMETMALLPSVERNILQTEGLGFVAVEDITIE